MLTCEGSGSNMGKGVTDHEEKYQVPGEQSYGELSICRKLNGG